MVTNIEIFCFMSVGQKLAMLKIDSRSVTYLLFVSLWYVPDLNAATEENLLAHANRQFFLKRMNFLLHKTFRYLYLTYICALL